VYKITKMTDVRYLGIYMYMVSSRVFKCSLHYAKCGLLSRSQRIFGKVGRVASEEILLQLIKSKCLPILLYCFEVCPLTKNDLNSLDFVINRFKVAANFRRTLSPSCRKLAATVHIHHHHCYYYSARKLIFILPSHEELKAEST